MKIPMIVMGGVPLVSQQSVVEQFCVSLGRNRHPTATVVASIQALTEDGSGLFNAVFRSQSG
jgi:hypothetical protein